MRGGEGDDEVTGGFGPDRISGGAGDDLVSGGFDNDSITGDAGDDELDGGPGRNTYLAGDGNDVVDAANGVRETRVNCGAGRRDVVRADANDRVRGCERIFRLERSTR